MSAPHPRHQLHLPKHPGERLADALTAFSGSFGFIGLHLAWFAAWVLLRVEPFPYGLLTTILSGEAIILSSIVLVSQNRISAKDAARDNLEAQEVGALFRQSQEIHTLLTGQERELKVLRQVNERQLETLLLLREHIGIEQEQLREED